MSWLPREIAEGITRIAGTNAGHIDAGVVRRHREAVHAADALAATGEIDDLALGAAVLGGALVTLYLDRADGRLRVTRDRLAEAAVALVFAVLEAVRRPD